MWRAIWCICLFELIFHFWLLLSWCKEYYDYHTFGHLDTWSGFEAAKTAPWPSRGLHFDKFLEPSDEWELVEDAVDSGSGDIVGHFWLIKNELQKLVELKFEFFSFNTFDVSQIFCNELHKRGPNRVIAFSWRDCAG